MESQNLLVRSLAVHQAGATSKESQMPFMLIWSKEQDCSWFSMPDHSKNEEQEC